jgi:hypothetical protein
MRPVLYATGWCAHNKGHRGLGRSERQNKDDYISNYWIPMIEGAGARGVHVYVSECDIQPCGLFLSHGNINLVYSHIPAKRLPYRHDWAVSAMTAAAYALANDMDMVYIEQDCLVYGLDMAVKMAQEQGGMWYGFGENSSYRPGWAANSFLYVNNDSLLPFIKSMHEIKDCIDGEIKLEQKFHKAIKHNFAIEYKDVHFWPFGVDRLRPIPWDQEIFYGQQLNDEELDRFMQKIGDK